MRENVPSKITVQYQSVHADWKLVTYSTLFNKVVFTIVPLEIFVGMFWEWTI